MSDIATLQRDIRTYQLLMLDGYDKFEVTEDQLKPWTKTFDNRTTRQNPFRLAEAFIFAEGYEWGDTQLLGADIDNLEWAIPVRGYSAGTRYGRVNIGRPEAVAKLPTVISKLGPALRRLQIKLMMDVFRKNPLAYDGANFFSAVHLHPADQGQYSNLITLSDLPDLDPEAPNMRDAAEVLAAVRARFVRNGSIISDTTWVPTRPSVSIVVHTEPWQKAFIALRDNDEFSELRSKNPDKGTFELLVSRVAPSDPQVFFWAALTDQAFPPTFTVIDTNPLLKAEEGKNWASGFAEIKAEQLFGIKAGFPQGAVAGKFGEPL